MLTAALLLDRETTPVRGTRLRVLQVSVLLLSAHLSILQGWRMCCTLRFVVTEVNEIQTQSNWVDIARCTNDRPATANAAMHA